MIKDDKQNHLLVISICHGTAFAISRASLKNISESSARGGWGWGGTEEEDGDASERGGECGGLWVQEGMRGRWVYLLVNEEAGKRDGRLAEVNNNRQRRLLGDRLWVNLGDVDQSCWFKTSTSLCSNVTTKANLL